MVDRVNRESTFRRLDIVSKIGLPTIQKKYPHFNEWLSKLERLSEEAINCKTV